MSIDANEVGKARSKIVEIAKAILAGDISYIEGVRVILTRWPEARADHLERDDIWLNRWGIPKRLIF